MRMSISTTSGFSRRAMSTACSAVDRLADDLDVVLGVEDHPEAGADERLVVGDQDADAHAASTGSRGAAAASAASASPCSGSRASTSKPPPGRGPACSSPPITRTRSRMPTRPWPPPSARGLGVPSPRSVISSCSSSPPRVHAHLGVAAGVLERVGQRLLHDAVGGEVDAGRQLARLAVDVQLDRQPGRAGALDQRAELVQRRLRRERGGLLAGVQHAEQVAHLAQRLAAGALDQRRGLDRALRVAGEDAPRAAGLDDHHRDAVGDDVVHLARDPAALVGDRARGVGLALLVRDLRGLVQLGGQLGARAHDAPGQPHQHAEDGREDDVARSRSRRAGQRDGGDRDGHDRRRAISARAPATFAPTM